MSTGDEQERPRHQAARGGEPTHTGGDTLAGALSIAVRQHVVLILAVTLGLTGLTAFYATSKAPRYTSTASVLVRPLPGNALSADSVASSQQITVAMETEAGLVNSPAVTAIVATKLHRDLGDGSIAVTASVPPNTEIVRLTYTASSATAAQQVADAFAQSFLDYRAAQAQSTQRFQLRRLRMQAQTAADNLQDASRAASSPHPPPDAGARVQLETNLLASLQANIGQLQVQDFNPGAVVAPANRPASPSGLSPAVLVAAMALVSLALALALAFWRERRGDRVRIRSEAAVAGVPILATVPGSAPHDRPLLDETGSDDVLHNVYRGARTMLLAATRRPSVIVVSAVTQTDPVAVVVANLGLSIASAGYRVTVVDATIDSRPVAPLLGIDDARRGVSDALTSDDPAGVEVARVRGLVVVPRGNHAVASREFYSGTGLAALFAALRTQADYVLVAAPPALTPEGDSVAVAGDAQLLVVADGSTTHQSILHAVSQADRLGVRVLGAVAVPAADRSHRGSSGTPQPTTSLRESRAGRPKNDSAVPPLAKTARTAASRSVRTLDGIADVG